MDYNKRISLMKHSLMAYMQVKNSIANDKDIELWMLVNALGKDGIEDLIKCFIEGNESYIKLELDEKIKERIDWHDNN